MNRQLWAAMAVGALLGVPAALASARFFPDNRQVAGVVGLVAFAVGFTAAMVILVRRQRGRAGDSCGKQNP